MNEQEAEPATLRVWFAIRDLELAFERLLGRVPSGSERPEAWLVYHKERQVLVPRIESLRQALDATLGPSSEGELPLAEQCFCALLIQWDERELMALGPGVSRHCPELWQTQFCAVYDGGERFFRYLEQALRLARAPALVLQIFLFCLRSGVRGRYSRMDHPERLAFEQELSRRVGAEGPQPSSAALLAAPAPKRIAGAQFPFVYYLGALAFVCGVWLFLRYDAQQEQTVQLGSEACKLK